MTFMQSAIYFACIRGRLGEVEAIHRLSPLARARAALVVDLPMLELPAGEPLEEHVGQFVSAVAAAWGVVSSLYVDLKRYGPEQTDAQGRHIVEHLFDGARQLKMKAIPVSGPLAERGPGKSYLEAVAQIASVDQRGAALRLPYTEFSDPGLLAREIDAGLKALSLSEKDVDLFLDTESLALLPDTDVNEPALFNTVVEAMKVVQRYAFRCVVFAGSSVPNQLGATSDGEPRVIVREEFKVWKRLIDAGIQPLPRFADTGIWSPWQADSGGGGGPPPARIRIPIGDQQVFFRAKSGEYRTLCRAALRYAGITDLPRCWGLDAIQRCADGGEAPSSATTWVARDTNAHIELTTRAVEAYLSKAGRIHEVPLANIRSAPWQQYSLIEAGVI
jgi:hypothetical protein